MASSGRLAQFRKSLAMGPSVKNLLNHYRLDPNDIKSTGPHQILLKSDVLNYIGQKDLAPKINESSTQKIPAQVSQTSASNKNIAPSDSKTNLTNTQVAKYRYARIYPSQLEIDIINSGGVRD